MFYQVQLFKFDKSVFFLQHYMVSIMTQNLESRKTTALLQAQVKRKGVLGSLAESPRLPNKHTSLTSDPLDIKEIFFALVRSLVSALQHADGRCHSCAAGWTGQHPTLLEAASWSLMAQG